MARLRDENRRKAILDASKELFARQGFERTTVADIVEKTGFPVGSIYTYFKSKEEIVRVIVEEGWREFHEALTNTITSEQDPNRRLTLLVERFFPMMFKDKDFITIILSEANEYVGIGEKIENLTSLIFDLIAATGSSKELFKDFPRASMKAGLGIFFLGSLYSARLAQITEAGVNDADIIDFIRRVIVNSLRIEPALAGQ
jgi:AcrR family transcriptional regulator